MICVHVTGVQKVQLCFTFVWNFIGAGMSEPHTSDVHAAFSLYYHHCMYVVLRILI